MKIVVFGLSITSSWGNGHATTYRSLLQALHARGHTIIFIEQDVPWYRDNRDLPDPPFCRTVLYSDWVGEHKALLRHADDADAIVVGSYFADGIAATQALLARAKAPVMFYDIDTPITLAGLREKGRVPYLEAAAIPGYAAYLSFTSGPALLELEQRFGARRADALLCSVDSERYRPVGAAPQYACDLSYLGTFALDRQGKLISLLNRTAERLPRSTFVVAGPQYPSDQVWAANVNRLDHVAPADHPAFYSSSRFTLNLTRADMIAAGYSPSVRLFEASACGAAILSDRWPGIESFFTPGDEILLPPDGDAVVNILSQMSDAERIKIGHRARERVLMEHTSAIRARQFEAIVAGC